MRPEIGQRPRIPRIEGEGASRQRHRFVEPVVVRGHFAGGAVDVAVTGGDRERLVGRGLELLRLVLHEREGGDERLRVEAGRVDGERPLERFVRLVVVAGVGGLAGEEHQGLNGRWVDLERLASEAHCLRRILVLQRAGRTQQRRHPPRVGLQRDLKRLHRVGLVVLLEKQLAPRRASRHLRDAPCAGRLDHPRRVGARHCHRLLERDRTRAGAVETLRAGHARQRDHQKGRPCAARHRDLERPARHEACLR